MIDLEVAPSGATKVLVSRLAKLEAQAKEFELLKKMIMIASEKGIEGDIHIYVAKNVAVASHNWSEILQKAQFNEM